MSHVPFDSPFAHSVADAKYMSPHGETHWSQTAKRAVSYPMTALMEHAGQKLHDEMNKQYALVRDRRFLPGGRYLYAAGNSFHQVNNCLLLSCEDSREGWADLSWRAEMALLTGAGIGVYWGDVRPGGTTVCRTGGTASGPTPKAIAINEQGRSSVQGGDRRSAIWGGLPWSHADVFKWITAKDWPQYIKDARSDYMELIATDPSEATRRYPNGLPEAPLDMTNISVCLDDEFFTAFEGHNVTVVDQQGRVHCLAPDGRTWSEWAQDVYWQTIDHMTQWGEPGFSVDVGDKRNEKLRNACVEIVSEDDSDVCNLGGLVLPRYETPQEFEEAVRLGTLFLLAGSVYSDVPYPRVAEVREKNRRLGLDLLGVHEFLLKRGLGYGSDDCFEALEPFMLAYDRALEFAQEQADSLGLSRPIAATSGAPTGTRGILAETTTSWEPVFCSAYKRSVITSKAHEADERTVSYIVDPTVSRLLREGWLLPTDRIEDSISLSRDYERRLRMQAYAQSHTDQAISMTINLPHVMKDERERRDFGHTLYRYLPYLRGITVYPDGAIAGQPIQPVTLAEATGNVFSSVEDEEKCASGACGL